MHNALTALAWLACVASGRRLSSSLGIARDIPTLAKLDGFNTSSFAFVPSVAGGRLRSRPLLEDHPALSMSAGDSSDAKQVRTPTASQVMRAKIQVAFEKIDSDNSSTLTYNELYPVMTLVWPTAGKEEVTELFSSMDANNNGEIDLNEFVDWLYDGMINTSREQIEELLDAVLCASLGECELGSEQEKTVIDEQIDKYIQRAEEQEAERLQKETKERAAFEARREKKRKEKIAKPDMTEDEFANLNLGIIDEEDEPHQAAESLDEQSMDSLLSLGDKMDNFLAQIDEEGEQASNSQVGIADNKTEQSNDVQFSVVEDAQISSPGSVSRKTVENASDDEETMESLISQIDDTMESFLAQIGDVGEQVKVQNTSTRSAVDVDRGESDKAISVEPVQQQGLSQTGVSKRAEESAIVQDDTDQELPGTIIFILVVVFLAILLIAALPIIL